MLIILGFILFTDTHSRWYRRIGGTLHGALHLAAAYGLGVLGETLALRLAQQWPVFTEWPLLQTLIVGLVLFGGGWVVGSFLMGLYLWSR